MRKQCRQTIDGEVSTDVSFEFDTDGAEVKNLIVKDMEGLDINLWLHDHGFLFFDGSKSEPVQEEEPTEEAVGEVKAEGDNAVKTEELWMRTSSWPTSGWNNLKGKRLLHISRHDEATFFEAYQEEESWLTLYDTIRCAGYPV